MEYKIIPYNHRAWLIQFENKPHQGKGFSKILCLNILRLAELFRQQAPIWQDIVPAYDSLLLTADGQLSSEEASAHIASIISKFKPQNKAAIPKTPIDIKVHYGGECGPDLERVSKSCGLSPEQIIAHHSAEPYLVCMLGFIPGFVFLSETHPAIHVPRRLDPRQHVSPGSVGLAGWQTGIYGLGSPGGWQIIGRISETLFDPKKADPFLLKAGDWIRFVPDNTPDNMSGAR